MTTSAELPLAVPDVDPELESLDEPLPPEEILTPDPDSLLANDGEVDTSDAEADEDDDNPYMNSDEALPDDEEEKVIERNPGREERLFDEI
ncbi:hypothetical protein BH10PSE7_BH10PSE7_05000 [soil metagenome]